MAKKKSKQTKKTKSKSKTIGDLTDPQVRAIRKKYSKSGASQRELAKEYGLGVHQIGRLTRGEARPDAGGPIETKGRAKLNKREVATLRGRYAKGAASQASLAREYGISAAAVSRLVRGHTYDSVGGPRVEKGGMPHGRKLTPKQILEVARSESNMSELARKFGVTRQAIQALRKRWKDRV
jgi:DNA-binding MarR family transcriptional regulator